MVSDHHPCCATDGPRSLAVKLNRIDLDRDGASPVAAPLLLGFLMPEGFAFGELQNLIGSLPPVSSCTPLVSRDRWLAHRRTMPGPCQFLLPAPANPNPENLLPTRTKSYPLSHSTPSRMVKTLSLLTLASKELSATRASTLISSSLILRNGEDPLRSP